MGKLEPFDRKQTKWFGLWFHPETNGFSSIAISLADLKRFKGAVRLYVKKNKYFNNGKNNRPNYHCCFMDCDVDEPMILEVENEIARQDEYGNWYTADGDRLYTYDEVQNAINRASEG